MEKSYLFIDKQALHTSMVCSSLLLVKCVITNFFMGLKRVAKGSRPPEDEILFGGKHSFDGKLQKYATSKEKR